MNTQSKSKELEAAEEEMNRLSKKISDSLANDDEKTAWQAQEELNEVNKKWRKLLLEFFESMRNDPNFYKPK